MVSLLKGMGVEDVDLEVAIALASLPRNLGTDADGVEILAHNGRYGPYIKRGADTRSLEAEDHLLSITNERALALLAQEKKGRGRSTPEPIKVFENVEALDGASIKLLKGRYGPYVSDGEVNASLPRDMENPESLTVDHALELLAVQREKKGKKKKTKKKAAKKKAAKKKTTKRRPPRSRPRRRRPPRRRPRARRPRAPATPTREPPTREPPTREPLTSRDAG